MSQTQQERDGKKSPGRMSNFIPTKKGAEVDFSGVELEHVATILDRFFTSRGFRLSSGNAGQGRYESGTASGRALWGGFTGRRKYDVASTLDGDSVHVSIASAMSGASGSVLGITKEKSQRKETTAVLKTYLESAEMMTYLESVS